ncbi:MAG: hypothetical protein FWE11_10290 [Defluviitaleaceae bacterium]|nr:hypothetical protein [Defluviitaleaceae bacterium]
MKKMKMLGKIVLPTLLLFICYQSVYASEPIPISAPEQLANIKDESYILVADIVLPPDWTPIEIFSGILDGQGHTISGLSINNNPSTSQGLFAKIENANISNVIIKDASINITGKNEIKAGLLAGEAINCQISNISVSGSISSTDAGKYIGGLVGHILGTPLTTNANHISEFINSSSHVKITGAPGITGGFAGKIEYTLTKNCVALGEVHGQGITGGFVGILLNNSRIIYSHAKGDIFSLGNQSAAGGFIGKITDTASVEFSYSTGSVITSGSPEGAVGGFAGIISDIGAPNTLTHCVTFASWIVGEGEHVKRFAGRTDHNGINGCYAYLGSMVINKKAIAHVLPSAYGPDGADMSTSQIEEITKLLKLND